MGFNKVGSCWTKVRRVERIRGNDEEAKGEGLSSPSREIRPSQEPPLPIEQMIGPSGAYEELERHAAPEQYPADSGGHNFDDFFIAEPPSH